MSAAVITMNQAMKPSVLQAVMKIVRPSGKKLFQEAHQFFIYPATQRVAPISVRFYTTRLARTASMYVPIYVGFFGWPFAAQRLITMTGGP